MNMMGTIPVASPTALRRMNFDIKMPKVSSALGYALTLHVAMFVWNPILFQGGHINQDPVLMQVEFRDKLPEMAKPEPKKEIAKPVAKKAKKSGIALAKHSLAPIHP